MNNGPPKFPHPDPCNLKCSLYGKRDFADVFKDLKVERLTSMINDPGGHLTQSQCSDKRKAEGALATGQERTRDGRSRDGSDVATGQAGGLRG